MEASAGKLPFRSLRKHLPRPPPTHFHTDRVHAVVAHLLLIRDLSRWATGSDQTSHAAAYQRCHQVRHLRRDLAGASILTCNWQRRRARYQQPTLSPTMTHAFNRKAKPACIQSDHPRSSTYPASPSPSSTSSRSYQATSSCRRAG